MSRAYAQPGPVARALELVGERWTILILQELLRGLHRFTDLKDSVHGIAPNVLSDRLKILEACGVVERKFYSDHPPRAEYLLTEKGRGLVPVLASIAEWGYKYELEESHRTEPRVIERMRRVQQSSDVTHARSS